jgi:hypothetical protein
MSNAKDMPIVEVSSETGKESNDNTQVNNNSKDNNTKKDFIDKKRKVVYNLDDNILKIIRADNDIHFKLLSNNKGVFVDIRRYNRGFPTQKGVRVYASVFRKVAELLKDDINAVVPSDDLNLSKLDKVISI